MPNFPRTHHHRLVCAAAVTLAFGALLLPASASALTVRPTAPDLPATAGPDLPATPGPALRALRSEPVDLVQVASQLSPPAPAAPRAPLPVKVTPAAPPAPALAPPPAPAFYSPAPGAPVTNPYGEENAEYAAGYHTGVDFAVDSGTPLRAVGAGTVVSAGWAGAYGQEVVLRLDDGLFAEYAHLSELAVEGGQEVAPGQPIGRSGSTGHSTGPHLHFEIRSENRYGAVIDPIAYLTARGATDF